MFLDAYQTIRFLTGLTVVAVILAVWPYSAFPAVDVKYALVSTLALISTIVWVVNTLRRGTTSDYHVTLPFLMFAFLTVNFVAAILAEPIAHALVSVLRFVTFVALFAVTASSFRKPSQALRLMRLTCVAVALASLYGFAQKLGYDPLPWATRDVEEYIKLPATFGNPNVAAYVLVLALILAVALAILPGNRGYLALAAIIGVHLYFTDVRSGPLAILSAAALVLVAKVLYALTQRPFLAVSATLFGMLSLGLVSLLLMVGTENESGDSRLPVDSSLLLRYNSNLSASKMIVERPLTGFGPGNYVIHNPLFWTPYEQLWYATENQKNSNVHNDYLELGVDAGIFGLLAYLLVLTALIVFSLLLGFLATTKEARCVGLALAASFCAFAVDGAFGFNLHTPAAATLFFVFAGVLQGLLSNELPFNARPVLPSSKRIAPILFAGITAAATIVEVRTFASRVQTQKSIAARHFGYPLDAYRFLQNANILAPWDWVILSEMGAINLALQDPNRAEENLRRSLQINPNWLPSRTRLAKAHLLMAIASPESALGQGDESLVRALEVAAAALAICPSDPSANEVAGTAMQLRGERWAAQRQAGEAAKSWRSALEYYRTGLRFCHDSLDRARLHRLMARVDAALGNTADARRSLVASVEVNPYDKASWEDFYQFTIKFGSSSTFAACTRKAIQSLQEEDDAEQEIVDRLLMLARLHFEGDHDVDSALRPVREALERSPKRLDAWGTFGLMYPAEDRLQAVTAFLEQTKSEIPEHTKSLPAPVLAFAGTLQAADQRDPGRIVSRVADLCVKRAELVSQDQLALEFQWLVEPLHRELLNEPANHRRALMLMNLGVVAQLLGDLNKAETMYSEAIPALPSQSLARAYLQRIDVLIDLERISEAMSAAKEARRQFPFDRELSVANLQLLARLGKFSEANVELRRLALDPTMPAQQLEELRSDLEKLKKQFEADRKTTRSHD